MAKPTSKTTPRHDGPGTAPDSAHGRQAAAELRLRDVVARMAREYLKPHWRLAAVALLASVVVAAATGVVPLLIKFALDSIVGTDAWMLLLISGAAIAATSVQAAATYISRVNMATIGQRIVAAVQKRMFGRIMHADLAWVSNTHSGRFISGFLYDANRVRDHADEDAPQGAHDDLDAWSHAEHLLRRRRIRVVALCAGRRQTSEQRQTLAPGQRGQWMHRALCAQGGPGVAHGC